MITFNTSTVNTVTSSSQDVRIVHGSGMDGDLAFAIAEPSGLKLFVRTNASPGGNISPVPIAGGTVGRIISLVPFFDGSFGFFYEVTGSGVHYTNVSPNGTINVNNVFISQLGDNYSVTVFGNDEFVLFTVRIIVDVLAVDARKYSKLVPPAEIPSSAPLPGGQVYTQAALANKAGFKIYSRLQTFGYKILAVLSLPLQDGYEQKIQGFTYDTAAGLFNGIRPLYQHYTNISKINEAFDDVRVDDGLWIIHEGAVVFDGDPTPPAPPSGAVYQTIHLMQPSDDPSQAIRAGFIDNFVPVVTLRPATDIIGPATGEFSTSPTLPLYGGVIHGGTGDIYSVGENQNLSSSFDADPYVYVWNRGAISSRTSLPKTEGVVESVAVSLSTDGHLLRTSAGKSGSFYALVSTGSQLALTRFTTPTPILPPPPPATTETTDFGTVTVLSSLSQIDPASVVGFAENSLGSFAILYTSNSNQTLNIVHRDSGGAVSTPFVIDTTGSGTIRGSTSFQNLITAPNDEFVVSYFKGTTSNSGAHVARIKADCSGFSSTFTAPAEIVPALAGLLMNQMNCLVYGDLTMICTYDNRMDNTDPSLKSISVKKLSSAGVVLTGLDLISFPNVKPSLRCFTRTKQSSGRFVISISRIDTSIASPNMITSVYSVDPTSISLGITTVFETGLAGDPSVNADYFAINDGLRVDGLWIHAPSSSGQKKMTMFRNSNPPLPDVALVGAPYDAAVSVGMFVPDVQGDWVSIEADSDIVVQNRFSGELTAASISTTETLLQFVVGDGHTLHALATASPGVKIVELIRQDVPAPSTTGDIVQVTQVISPPIPVTAAPPRTGDIEMPAIAKNVYGEFAVLRFLPFDTSDNFQRKGRLFLDLYDSSLLYVSSVLLADELTSGAIVLRNDDADVRVRNVPPYIVPLFESGNFLVYWGELLSPQGSAQFKYSIVTRAGITLVSRAALTPVGIHAWCAQVTAFPDDRFVVAYLEWNPSTFTSKAMYTSFNSFGQESAPRIIASGGQLSFEKKVIAREFMGNKWMVVYSLTESSISDEKTYFVATAPYPSLVPVSVTPYEYESTEAPSVITGVPDYDSESLWLDEGAFTVLIRPAEDVYEQVSSFAGDKSLPTVFRRAVFDTSRNLYGIKAKNPPQIQRMLRSGVNEFMGDLRNSLGEDLFTGATFADAAIAGTGERLVVPVYRSSLHESYDLAVLTLNASPADPPGVVGTPVVITSASLPDAEEGVAYSFFVGATGSAPINWTATGLPAGLSMTGLTGEISGIATASGVFEVVITGTNSAGSAERAYQFVVQECVVAAGLIEISGPHVSAPVLPGSEVLGPESVLASGQDIFWSAHKVLSGALQGASLQRHNVAFGNVGTAIVCQAPDTFVTGQLSVDIATDVNDSVIAVIGGVEKELSATVRQSILLAAKFDADGVEVFPLTNVAQSSFVGLRLNPRIFAFSDGTSAIIWFEGRDLKLSMLSPSGTVVFERRVASNVNSEIPAAITGNKNGSLLDVVYSDGFSIGVARYDRQGTLSRQTVIPLRTGERLRALDAVHSIFDSQITVAAFVRKGASAPFEDRVVLQKFDINGISSTRRYSTAAVDMADLGLTSGSRVLELPDGSFVLSYFDNNTNKSALLRFDRCMAPIGVAIEKTGATSSRQISICEMDEFIAWGYHSAVSLDLYKMRIDCAIESPGTPSSVPGTGAPGECRTV